eukprot:3034382-Rhodomonas_salina.1
MQWRRQHSSYNCMEVFSVANVHLSLTLVRCAHYCHQLLQELTPPKIPCVGEQFAQQMAKSVK